MNNVFDMKEWMAGKTLPIHNISKPHALKIVKAPSENVVMQYKNWAGSETETWKPEHADQDQWLTLLSVSRFLTQIF